MFEEIKEEEEKKEMRFRPKRKPDIKMNPEESLIKPNDVFIF